MRIKQRPEDFEVTESYRFDTVETGPFRVYAMDKQKLGTLDAIERIRLRHRLKREQFSVCGLKDKQGRTRQLIAVRDADVDVQDEDLRLKLLGRTDRPLSAANITSNRFSVTVRDLGADDLAELPASLSEVQRVGVVNYFDSQRFGHIKHGQGLIGRELVHGRFERALQAFMAVPSELDGSYDAKVKAFWRDKWGRWDLTCNIPGAEKYRPLVEHLREKPEDFAGAFMKVDMRTRTMVLYTYQSFLWNECVRRYLMEVVPHEQLMALPYQAGTLLFHRDAPAEVLRDLRGLGFPLLAPDAPISAGPMKRAVDWVLGREKVELAKLVVPGVKQMFFKYEPRPLLVYPGKLVIGKQRDDELERGRIKTNVAFTLPPGAYATLVVKRLFWFCIEKSRQAELEDERGKREALAKREEIAFRQANPEPTYRQKLAAEKAAKAQRRAEAAARTAPAAKADKPRSPGRKRNREAAPKKDDSAP